MNQRVTPFDTGGFDHGAAIVALEAALEEAVAVASRTPAEIHIPTCPDWSAAELWEHLGAVHRWTTKMVSERSTEPISRRSIQLDPPADGRWAPWLAEGASALLAVLGDTDPDQPVWSWGPDQHARWWSRRQLHETVVHTADGALANGEGFSVAPSVAADGISELLDNAAVRLTWADATPPPSDATVHIHATDDSIGHQGELMVELSGGAISYTHAHGKGDVAVRGPASELMLVVNRRRSLADTSVEVFGEATLLEDLIVAVGH